MIFTLLNYTVFLFISFLHLSCPCLIKQAWKWILLYLFIRVDIGVYHTRLQLHPLFLLSLIIYTRHADVSHHGDRDGGVYPGYSKSHWSTRLQSTPKPADSWRKIRGDTKKAHHQLFSGLCTPFALSQPSTLWVTPPLFGVLFLPHDHTLHFPFHAFSFWQCLPLYQMWVSPVFTPPVQQCSPIPILGSNFPIPFIL